MNADRYVSLKEAREATGLNNDQIRYRCLQGLCRYLEDPLTHRRKPWLADLLVMVAQEKGYAPPLPGEQR